VRFGLRLGYTLQLCFSSSRGLVSSVGGSTSARWALRNAVFSSLFRFFSSLRARAALAARSAGNRVSLAPSRTAPKTRKETMSDALHLARAEIQIGDTVGAENYYQYAEHFFRSMRARGMTTPYEIASESKKA